MAASCSSIWSILNSMPNITTFSVIHEPLGTSEKIFEKSNLMEVTKLNTCNSVHTLVTCEACAVQTGGGVTDSVHALVTCEA